MAAPRSAKYKIIFFALSLVTALVLYYASLFICKIASLSDSVIPIIIIAVVYAVAARYLNRLAAWLADKLGG